MSYHREQRIYDAHNAEFLLQRRFSETAAAPAARLYSRVQWRRLERFERAVVRGSRLTLAVSNHDANQLRALAGADAQVSGRPQRHRCAVVSLRRADDRTRRRTRSCFWANWIFGRTRTRCAGSSTRCSPDLPERGCSRWARAPPAWLVGAGQHDDRIAVTGYVDDERPYLARCAALVLPLQAGGGSRLKALIAMASGLPDCLDATGDGRPRRGAGRSFPARRFGRRLGGMPRSACWATLELRQRLARAGRDAGRTALRLVGDSRRRASGVHGRCLQAEPMAAPRGGWLWPAARLSGAAAGGQRGQRGAARHADHRPAPPLGGGDRAAAPVDAVEPAGRRQQRWA